MPFPFGIGFATAALLIGTSTIFAQHQGGAPGGAPAGQMAPKSSGGGQTTGKPAAPGAVHNGPADIKGGNNVAEERGEQSKPNRAGDAQPNRRETTGQAAPQNERTQQNERKESQSNERRENKAEGNKATNGATEERRLRATEQRGNANERNRTTEERGNVRDNDRNRATTGQGAAGSRASANLTPEKRTQLHQAVVKERSAPRVDRVDFSLSVGTAVPRSVRFVPVPSTIVEIEPSWRGYDYFVVGDQIVIVDPRSMEIVAVIDA
jgi:hypothetical protein